MASALSRASLFAATYPWFAYHQHHSYAGSRLVQCKRAAQPTRNAIERYRLSAIASIQLYKMSIARARGEGEADQRERHWAHSRGISRGSAPQLLAHMARGSCSPGELTCVRYDTLT